MSSAVIQPEEQRYGSMQSREGIIKSETRKVVDILGIGRYQILLMCTLGLLIMSDSVESSLLGFLYECAGSSFGLSRTYASAIVSIVFLGEFVSAMIAGVLSDIFVGRSAMILLAASLLMVFGLVSATAPNYITLIAARFIVGLALGMFVIPYDVGIEWSPAPVRGKLVQFISCWWGLGAAFITCCAWIILPISNWRVLVIAAAFPATVAFAILCYILRESPLFLVEQERYAEAVDSLAEVAHFNHDSSVETTEALNRLQKAITYSAAEEDDPSHTHTKKVEASAATDTTFSQRISFTFLAYFANIRELHRDHGRTALLLDVIWFIMVLSFYCINLLTSRIFSGGSSGLACSFNYKIIFLVYSCEVFGSFFVLSVIDLIGRRLTLRVAALGTALFLLPVAISDVVLNTAPAIIICLMCTSAAVTAFSNTLFVYTPELFPTHLRATGHTLAYAISRLGAALATFLVDDILPIRVSAALISGLCFIAVLIALDLKETKATRLD